MECLKKSFTLYLLLTIISLTLSSQSVYCQNYDPILLSSASNGNLEGVKDALDKGADINTTDSLGNSPLALAAKAGSLPIVKFLLKNDANPNQQNEDNLTPADVAFSSDNESIGKLIIQHGGNAPEFKEYEKTQKKEEQQEESQRREREDKGQDIDTVIIDTETEYQEEDPDVVEYTESGPESDIDRMGDALEESIKEGPYTLDPRDPIDKERLETIYREDPSSTAANNSLYNWRQRYF